MTLPLWARRFVLDFVETALAALLALTLTIPGDLDAAKAEALVVGAALLAALVAAVRRAIPGFLAWLALRLNVSKE